MINKYRNKTGWGWGWRWAFLFKNSLIEHIISANFIQIFNHKPNRNEISSVQSKNKEREKYNVTNRNKSKYID
jgi:hypothetical protein